MSPKSDCTVYIGSDFVFLLNTVAAAIWTKSQNVKRVITSLTYRADNQLLVLEIFQEFHIITLLYHNLLMLKFKVLET